jgi:hypothetical protein
MGDGLAGVIATIEPFALGAGTGALGALFATGTFAAGKIPEPGGGVTGADALSFSGADGTGADSRAGGKMADLVMADRRGARAEWSVCGRHRT